jgi:hypothetical protein
MERPMPKPRKKTKNLEVSYESNKRPQRSSTDDFVGNFLVGIFTAFITALFSQAVSDQINWLVVVVVTALAIIVIALYQSRR